MKVIVIYDSNSGNTEQIAYLLSSILFQNHDVITKKAIDVDENDLQDIDCLILGNPIVSAGKTTKNINSLLKIISKNSNSIKYFFVFDTILDVENIENRIKKTFYEKRKTVAEKIDNKLIRYGLKEIMPYKNFVVNTKSGPLKKGEIESISLIGEKLVEEINKI